MLENREISEISVRQQLTDRLGKACGRNPDVYVSEKSDIGVVPKKVPNKTAIHSCGGTGGKAGDQGEF
jgi:hypothetical protein